MGNLAQDKIIIYEKGETVASCLGTRYNNGKAYVMILDSVWVEEKHRKMGYGKQLMDKVITFALRCQVDAIELVVNRDNEVAKKLYQKVGLENTGKEYYRLILRRL